MSLTNTPRRSVDLAPRNTLPAPTTRLSTGIPFWDMMLSFGQAASQQAMSGFGTAVVDQSDRKAARVAGDVEVIALGEETLHVGKRVVAGEITRVRRVVVETPVEQDVLLREERVIVERRKPSAATATTTQGLLSGADVEMSDSFEVIESWKSARVTEEVVLRREVTMRTETVRGTVRHDEVVIEQAGKPALRTKSLPAVALDRPIHGDRAPVPAEAGKVATAPVDATDNERMNALGRADAGTNKVGAPIPTPKADAPKPVYAEAKSTAPIGGSSDTDRNDKPGLPRKV